MHSLLRTLFLITIGIQPFLPAIAQCPGCIPDLSCTVSPAFPTICPAQPPTATSGEYYETDITFWMPATFTDPGSGFTVDLTQLTVTGVTGMPFGLDLETSDPAGVYFPQQNEFGCARICGTPLIAGTYSVTISILATVSFSGLVTQVPEQFIMLLHVLPGAGGNNSFTFDPSSGCGNVTASFQALITDPSAPVTYSWDFGNGETSDQLQPLPQTYDEPGSYHVSLQTTIGGFVLNTVNVTGVNDNWCGDIDEPNLPFIGCSGSPDLYFALTDAGGQTWTSSTYDNTFSATWSDLGLVLSAPPYSLAVYDEDQFSQDDHLGTYNIPLDGAGTYYFNVAGGTTGSLEISLQTQQEFWDMDTIVVHPLPVVEIVEQEGQLCAADTSLIGHVWLLNGDTLSDNGACLGTMLAGSYQLIAFNGSGCQSISGAFVVCPDLEITQTENVLSVASGFSNYSWTLDGELIPGADGSFIIIQEAGNYSVTVNAGDDCIVTATMSLVSDIEELSEGAVTLMIHPNPSNGLFIVTADGLSGSTARIQLFDALGKVVHERKEPVGGHKLEVVILAETGPGLYHLRISDDRNIFTRRVIIR